MGEADVTRKPGSRSVLRRVLRTNHCSLRTEQAYLGWIRRFIAENRPNHPRELGAEAVSRFLSRLAVERSVSAGTQNQALAALLFLYRRVLGIELPWLDDLIRARQTVRVPTVLSREEVQRLLALVDGSAGSSSVLYGSGLRIGEATRLRIKDMDFARREITVRDGKRTKDWRTPLPRSIEATLREQVERALEVHRRTAPLERRVSGFRTRWRASIRTPRPSLAGSTPFRRRASPGMHARRYAGVIMSIPSACSAWSSRPREKPISSSTSPVPRCGIRSRRMLESGVDIRTVRNFSDIAT
jgi:integrase